MKLEHYVKRVEESKEFQKFLEKNPNADLCAGFFVLDFESGKHIHQVDYMLPNKKVATFMLDEGIKIKISEQAIKKDLPKINCGAKTDIDALKGIVEDEMKNRIVTEKIKKIIAVYHLHEGKPIWNLQCILDGLGILLIHIDDSDQSILKFEKHSLMELIKPQSDMMIAPKSGMNAVKGKMGAKDLNKLQEAFNIAMKKAIKEKGKETPKKEQRQKKK